MATVALRRSLKLVVDILRRYGLSLSHGALTLVLGTAVLLSGNFRNYGSILWGFVSAQACLLGFWMALAARPWHSRMAYGGLHLLGLVFCILAAWHMSLEPLWFYPFEILRDVPALLTSTWVAGSLLRRRGWKLFSGPGDDLSAAPTARRMQIPLGEFIKWFTLLCIVLGLSVSLLPPPSMLLDDWLWRSRMRGYADFFLLVCIPAASLASLIFVATLVRPATLRRIIWMSAAWCGLTLLFVAAVIAGLNLVYNGYYFFQSPTRPLIELPRLFVSLETIRYGLPGNSYWSLLAFLATLVFVAVTSVLAGWRIGPVNNPR